MAALAPPVHMHVLRGIIMGGYCFFAFSRCNLGTNSGAGEVLFLRTQIFFSWISRHVLWRGGGSRVHPGVCGL